MKQKIKVAIAEDHNEYRKTVVKFLNSTPICEVVLEQENGENIIENLKAFAPDVLLLDLQMPVVDGFSALDEIRNSLPSQKVIIYSSLFSKKVGLMIFGGKIQDYLPKHTSSEDLVNSIVKVFDG